MGLKAMQQVSPEITDRLRRLLAGGRKIEAIKLYREQTGAGLAQAKDAVEALAQGSPAVDLGHGPESMRDLSPQLLDDLRRLLGEGRKIEAIKLYRERTGADLARAKAMVEAFARGESLAMFDQIFDRELQRFVAGGERIRAIKLYRERFGCGLKEAKEAVDRLPAICPACESEIAAGATECPSCGRVLAPASQSGLALWIALAVVLAAGAGVTAWLRF